MAGGPCSGCGHTVSRNAAAAITCPRGALPLSRSADYSRRGLIFQVAARMPAVVNPATSAASGIASVSAAVAAHPIEEKASANVASRDDVWRRRNWLRFACTRNQSWIAVADAAATMTPEVVTAACRGEANV